MEPQIYNGVRLTIHASLLPYENHALLSISYAPSYDLIADALAERGLEKYFSERLLPCRGKYFAGYAYRYVSDEQMILVPQRVRIYVGEYSSFFIYSEDDLNCPALTLYEGALKVNLAVLRVIPINNTTLQIPVDIPYLPFFSTSLKVMIQLYRKFLLSLLPSAEIRTKITVRV